MNAKRQILFIESYDPAAQGYLTCKAMRKHLGWNARNVITAQTWLEYDYDWQVGKERTIEEIVTFAEDCDFVFIQDGFVPKELEPVTKTNCFKKGRTAVVAYGTPLRNTMDRWLARSIRGAAVLVPPFEYTMVPEMITIPLNHQIVDVEGVEKYSEEIKRNDKITICHATVSYNRGREIYEKVVGKLKEKYDIQFDVIQGMNWRSTIRKKAEAHITIDSNLIHIPGLNCMEGLLLGHEVVSNISPWVYMVHPDLPIHSFNVAYRESTGDSIEKTIYTKLENAIKSIEDGTNDAQRDKYRKWVIDNNRPEIVAKRFEHFLEFVDSRSKEWKT